MIKTQFEMQDTLFCIKVKQVYDNNLFLQVWWCILYLKCAKDSCMNIFASKIISQYIYTKKNTRRTTGAQECNLLTSLEQFWSDFVL